MRAGQHGIGKTVFQGNKIEEFQVEILGVLENVGPHQSVILARLPGGPLAQTGVMQGMSGSPVYIDGRLVGAVALAFNFSKEPIAGIRPIEEMLAVGRFGQRPSPRLRWPRTRIRLASQTIRYCDAGFVQRIHRRDTRPVRAAAQEIRAGAAPGRIQRRQAPIKTWRARVVATRGYDRGKAALG